MTRNGSKVVKPGWAARVLAIAYTDLPKKDGPWTKGDVRILQSKRPEWLTDARRRHATAREVAGQARTDLLVKTLRDLGYGDADVGTLDFYYGRIDGALTHLQIATNCTESEADRAAWVLWPKTMAEVEQDEEAEMPSRAW